jgi:peptidyl-tRNA hydrolase
MPLYMDIHKKVDGATAAAVADAHQKDVQTQDKYGVKYLKYWLDETSGTIFCLVEAPNKESAEQVHRQAHGLVADEIHEVAENS